MTLTSNGKKYIADKFGSGTPKCYVPSGLSWTYLGTDNVIYSESGGTSQIVSRLVMPALVKSVTFNGVTYTNADLVAGNDGTAVSLDDAKWVAANDGEPVGEAQYCISTVSITFPSPPGLTGMYLRIPSEGIHELLPATITLECGADYECTAEFPNLATKYEVGLHFIIRINPDCSVVCLNVDGHIEWCGKTDAPSIVVVGTTITCHIEQRLCAWLVNEVGTSITAPCIFKLVDGFIGTVPIEGLTPSIDDIMGTVDYYLGFLDSGDAKTGCNYKRRIGG